MHDVISLLINRYDFFLQLLWEHIEISVLASVVAIIIGGLLGVLIYEYKRLAAPVMVMVNFLYTIPSISMLGLCCMYRVSVIRRLLLHWLYMLYYRWYEIHLLVLTRLIKPCVKRELR